MLNRALALPLGTASHLFPSSRLLPLLLAVGALVTHSACIASTVISKEERLAEAQAPAIPWVEAEASNLGGMWESTAIEGAAAAVVWKIYYYFAKDGSYTGAALVLAEENPEFQTLSGSWSLSGGRLSLDQSEPVPAWTHGENLRLDSQNGTAAFRRVRL